MRSRSGSGPSSGSRERNFTCGARLPQVIDPPQVLGILDVTPIQSVRPRKDRIKIRQPVRTLGEDLELMPVGVASSTSKTRRMKSIGTSSWNRSLMELTKIVWGSSSLRACPACARAAETGTSGVVRLPHGLETPGHSLRIAVQHPGLILVQPVTGFQVDSVHSIDDPALIRSPYLAGNVTRISSANPLLRFLPAVLIVPSFSSTSSMSL